MAFSGNFFCTSFKQELLKGVHNLSASGGNSFKMALYTNSASFTAATTAYTSSNEVSGTGYSAGGQGLTNVDPLTSGTHSVCRVWRYNVGIKHDYCPRRFDLQRYGLR